MMLMMMASMMIMAISLVMMILVTLISKKSSMDREKNSPFECGFDPISHSRLPFSLQFFLIAVIFLIFDVEITLLMPMVSIMKISNLLKFSITVSVFLTILLIGIIHEWKQGALDWTI